MLNNKTATELKAILKSKGAVGYSKMKKQEMIDAITSGNFATTEASMMKALTGDFVLDIANKI